MLVTKESVQGGILVQSLLVEVEDSGSRVGSGVLVKGSVIDCAPTFLSITALRLQDLLGFFIVNMENRFQRLDLSRGR